MLSVAKHLLIPRITADSSVASLLQKDIFFLRITTQSEFDFQGCFSIAYYGFTLLSLSEFVTTLTELNAIANAASIGLRSPNAATGIPITL